MHEPTTHQARDRRPTPRRDFIKTAGVAAVAATAASPSVGKAADSAGPLGVGLIGCGNRMKALVKAILTLRGEAKAEIVAISELFGPFRDHTLGTIEKAGGARVPNYLDYRDILARDDVDAVVVATPDHWHARQTLDALAAGKHVYCEKPMTHTIDEAAAVVAAWRSSGRVMQVGVQSSSHPLWTTVRNDINAGRLGKVLQFQTEYFRNSNYGQVRQHELTADMTPETIDWRRWLGVEEGLCPDVPFDRALFRQWRAYWPYGAGMLTDLFVHRLTAMLKATGLRYPARVAASGGIFLEYDGRDVPDVATITVDYDEGVQGIISATMCADAARLPHTIRGHFGSFVFDQTERPTTCDFVAERPQVTRDSANQSATVAVENIQDTVLLHMRNFVDAALAGKPELCNNTPDLGAAAVVTIQLGKRSYREGKIFCYDPATGTVTEGSEAWAKRWEKMSQEHAKPPHVPGWSAGDRGSVIYPPDYMKLAGPWIDGKPPESRGS